jgi:predicted nucleic acid-binding protein
VLVDAGPIVAILDRSDDAHRICVATWKKLPRPPVTVWPVLAEAIYLLAFSIDAQDEVLGWVESGAVEIASLGREDSPRIRELMRKYRDLQMDLADAALVRVAERTSTRRVFTLDRRDFEVYRPARTGRFSIIP